MLPRPAKRGRPPIDRRRIIDAILYLVKCGCPWRYLPTDFPHWKTVYHVFRQWIASHQWAAFNDVLRTLVRQTHGKRSRPTAAILDSQSVKSADHGGNVGYDAGQADQGPEAPSAGGFFGPGARCGGGSIILPGNNNYSGATTINAGTLQIGIGGASGTLTNGASIVDNGTLIYNSTATVNVNGLFGAGITGSGNVIVRNGTLQAIGNNSYTGWTEIDPGATFQPCSGPVGLLASSVVTNNGTLLMVRQDNGVFIYSGNIVGSGSVIKACNNGNSGDVTLNGQNTYTGGTYIIGGTIIFGDNSTPGAGSFLGNVFMTNDYVHLSFPGQTQVPAVLEFNRPDDFTFSNNIVGEGNLLLQGSARVPLTGMNTYTNTTTINSGILQIGNGGTTGTIGTGSITDGTELDFDRSDNVTLGQTISGGGSLVQLGSGTLTLGATNTYLGSTTISNGTLVLTGGSVGGDVAVEGGNLFAASLTTGGSLNVAGNLNIDAGTVLAPLNNSLSVTNIVVAGTINRTGGSVVVTNVGPALAVNNKFYLFSSPVSGFATVTGAGATWQNNLSTDGSITALTVPLLVNTNPPVMQVSVSGNTLSLRWPTNLGWTLETNSVGLTSPSSWSRVTSSSGVTNMSITINPANPQMFFRMVYP